MKLNRQTVPIKQRLTSLKSALDSGKHRLGLITSLDGGQIITLVLDPESGSAECWDSPVERNQYPSLTPMIPQCHWFERGLWDLFGLYPDGHPRLKHLLLHDAYADDFVPLKTTTGTIEPFPDKRSYDFLKVQGAGVYEIPVGPIHAGVIEPGHFRLSCLGEIILNLEIRLGYLHRGIEKRLTEVPWKDARFVAEAAASDTAVANALAHAIAIESIFAIEAPPRAQFLRTLALEIERIAMHIIDIGGMATDIGFLGIASSMSRLRGNALRLGELLAGSRFMRGFICPGGVVRDCSDQNLERIEKAIRQLRFQLEPVIAMFMDNPVAEERLAGVCKVSPSLAREFGLVGVAARACGIAYDTRHHFQYDLFPTRAPRLVVEQAGDVLSRVNVRISELFNSLSFIYNLVHDMPPGATRAELPPALPAAAIGAGIVEAFRGELIHLVFTDRQGKISRYAIKDPSFNNWTGVSIAVRNNLVADFPICNKSFSLSYGGHDL